MKPNKFKNMATKTTGKGKPAPTVTATPQTARQLLQSVHTALIKSVTVARNGDNDDFVIELDWMGLQSYDVHLLHRDINGVLKFTYLNITRYSDFQAPIPVTITTSWPHGGMNPKEYFIGASAEGGWVVDGRTVTAP